VSTDEEDDVGVVEFGEEGHLGAELEHAPLVELLLDELLDSDVDALPAALEHDAVGPEPDLPAQLDLLEVDHPPAQVGRRQEVVLLEHHPLLAHILLHLRPDITIIFIVIISACAVVCVCAVVRAGACAVSN
jgi:hypothetical protein